MSFPELFRLTLFLLVLDALGALYLTRLLGWPSLLAIVAAIGASWWAEDIRARIPNYRRLWDILTGVFLAYAVMDFLFLGNSFMAGVIHLLLFLQLYKLYNARTHRDVLDIFLLTFLQLVAACTLTVSFGFLLIFCLYMILGTWGLILFHLKRETDNALPERSRDLLAGSGLLAPGFFLSAVGLAGAALLLTLAIFLVIPRVGRTYLPLKAQLGTLTTGFADRVDLGAYGTIQNDPTIVMRISFSEGSMHPDRLPDLRWRGLAFDTFDGRTWSLRDPARTPVRRTRDGSFSVLPPRWSAPFLVYEVFLEPIGTEVIFGLPRVVTVQGRFPSLATDMGEGLNLAAPPSSWLRYLAISQPPRLQEAALRQPVRAGDYPKEIRETYLQLPDLSPRLRRLARELGAGAESPYDVVRRVEAHLSDTLRYSLDLRPESNQDPLDNFLFSQKAGNCEFFAASMAILLRAQGIPARVVSGFQRGEWNEVGQYFAVRQRDAHAWVEVFFPGEGWVAFDPSPRTTFDQETFAASGWTRKYLDALRMQWNRYVIDYNVGDQAQVVMNLHRQSLAFRRAIGQVWEGWRRYASLAGAVLVILAVTATLWRRGPWGGAGVPRMRARGRPVLFYERMIRLLARRGFGRPPAVTAREFASTLAGRPELHGPVSELTALYERVRFGGEPLASADPARIAGLLRALATAAR